MSSGKTRKEIRKTYPRSKYKLRTSHPRKREGEWITTALKRKKSGELAKTKYKGRERAVHWQVEERKKKKPKSSPLI